MDTILKYNAPASTIDVSFVYNPNIRDCWISVNDGEPIRIPGGATVRL